MKKVDSYNTIDTDLLLVTNNVIHILMGLWVCESQLTVPYYTDSPKLTKSSVKIYDHIENNKLE